MTSIAEAGVFAAESVSECSGAAASQNRRAWHPLPTQCIRETQRIRELGDSGLVRGDVRLVERAHRALLPQRAAGRPFVCATVSWPDVRSVTVLFRARSAGSVGPSPLLSPLLRRPQVLLSRPRSRPLVPALRRLWG